MVGGDEAGVRADQHHPLEADVEHARALGDELAERREHERHAGEDRAGDERREGACSEKTSVAASTVVMPSPAAAACDATRADSCRRARRRRAIHSVSAMKISVRPTSSSVNFGVKPAFWAA